jgi:hypothetical protein
MLTRGKDLFYKRLWVWVKPERFSGLPMPHWAPMPAYRGKNAVRIFPPSRQNRCWAIEVDGIAVAELRGIDATELALCVAEAFARQKDGFRTVLRAQRFMRRREWEREYRKKG